MKPLLLLITLLCLLVDGTIPANAQNHIKTSASIVAVSKKSISVKSGHLTHTYKISTTTAIHLDGRKVNAKDLRKGMHADVTVSQLDPTTASAIEASGS